MRLKANKMGYSLNQRGLFAGVVRSLEDRTIKTNAGERLEYVFLIPRVSLLPFAIERELARGGWLFAHALGT